MKKIVIFITLILALLMCMASCDLLPSLNLNPEHTHEFEEWSITENATCTNNGVKTRYCSCGEKQTESIPKLSHNVVDYICTVCGEVIGSEGLSYELNSDGMSYFVKGIGACTDTHLRIPSVYNDLPVTSIGDYAFEYCSELTSITIPDSVTSIGGFAFAYCSSLTSVTIPDSVTSIDSTAFFMCDSLTSVTVSDNNTAYKSIDGNLYSKDGKTLIQYAIGKKDVSFAIPEGVTNIDVVAFMNCSSLINIFIPNSVTSVGSSAFGNCTSLTCNEYDNAYYLGNPSNPYIVLVKAKSIDITSCKIHENTKFIHTSAFYGCQNLTGIIIPNNVTSIGFMAFYWCHNITTITVPASVTSINSYAFGECSSLTNITVDENNESYKSLDGNLYTKDGKTLLQYALGKMNNLFNIPDSVTSIGNGAFRFCRSLTSITIPDSVTIIDTHAFANCGSLTSIKFKGTVEQWNAIIKKDGWNDSTGSYTIYCTDGEITKDGTVTYY